MDNIGLKHRPTVLYNYIMPLVNEGLLVMTVQDKPKSPKQKYGTTKKGKKILEEKQNC